MDKKIFSIEEQYNNQYKIYAQTSLEVSSEGTGGHHPSYVMVWWGVYHQGMIPLHFCEKSVKTGVQVYYKGVLQGVVKPLNTTVVNGQKWVFHHDSTPAHKAKTTQEWLWRNVPTFISAKDWHSGIPDLNPLDYKLWAVLQDMAWQKCHNLDRLKRCLVKAAAEIPQEMVHAAIAEWLEDLKACVGAEGSHFE